MASKRARSPSVTSTQLAAAGLVLLALVAVPAPLLPPHRLAQAVQSVLGSDNWKAAYLLAAIGTQALFYGALGVLATLSLNLRRSTRGQLLQAAIAPLAVVGLAVLIRSIKLGHIPVLINLAVPVAACVAGVGIGLALRYRGRKTALAIAALVAGAALWAWYAAPSTDLAQATASHVRRLVAAGPDLPAGEARFGAILQTAFSPLPDAAYSSAVEHNRAAILALGIVLGHEKLGRLVGVHMSEGILRGIGALRSGTSLAGRDDWSRHYSLSAGLAALQHPFASDAAGLLKEEVDALAQGSGFSFADLAADRAGVRFAAAATHSDAAAGMMQARLQRGFVVSDFFPRVADLPENLTAEHFRGDYGGVGSSQYRRLIAEIESRLDACPALTPIPPK